MLASKFSYAMAVLVEFGGSIYDDNFFVQKRCDLVCSSVVSLPGMP